MWLTSGNTLILMSVSWPVSDLFQVYISTRRRSDKVLYTVPSVVNSNALFTAI